MPPPCGILHMFYLHAQTTVDAGDMRTQQATVILITRKPEDPQFEPHVRINMVQVLGSPSYICGKTSSMEGGGKLNG